MKVFLSSTAQDLVKYRQVADDTILRLQNESVVMERFGPRPGAPVAESEAAARTCEVLVCIVAHRYGTVPDPGQGSITHREVKAAKDAGKDVFVWIVDDAHPWSQPREQDLLTNPSVLADAERVAKVVQNIQALGEFKAWLKDTFTCETFTDENDLGRKISLALANRSKERQGDAPRAKPLAKGEVRIVHALQPAPRFQGRKRLLKELNEWVSDVASPDRVWSLVAAGGTGKTAIAERIVREMKPGIANVLVWSFYEKPDAGAFLAECASLFLGEQEGEAGGRLERLQRGLRDGRPHLIVLDGLERVQEEAGQGRVRGELEDHTLKLLLRALAAGLGRTRALVTSRFPLVDLQDWAGKGYRETPLDDLHVEAALALLRSWDVVGEDQDLRSVCRDVGNHALTVAVLGSYLKWFCEGRIDGVRQFDLRAATGEDPKAAKLSRVLGYYAEKLPELERELLARLSVFPRGVSLELLGVVVDAGGKVAGRLLNAGPQLVRLLNNLKQRGLVFEYRDEGTVTWTAHPFLRDSFRDLLGCPSEQVFGVVAKSLGAGLESRPQNMPTESAMLDRYERLIEATRLAGRLKRAFELYCFGLGGFMHLGKVLGENERGYRMLAAFGLTEHRGLGWGDLTERNRSLLLTDLGLFARELGRLAEVKTICEIEERVARQLGDSGDTAISLRNQWGTATDLGLTPHAARLAAEAESLTPKDGPKASYSPTYRAASSHQLGYLSDARDLFQAAEELQGRTLYSILGTLLARHHLDLGDLSAAREVTDNGLATAERNNWNHEKPAWRALLASICLAERADPTSHLEEIRTWTARSGQMEWIITAHLLAARYRLVQCDAQGAMEEAEAGLIHAEACGYRLLQIELLTTIAQIHLAWPNASKAIQSARKALDLASHEDCCWAWGEADAAHVWGEAYFANREFELAHRAFKRALEVRTRIEHPKAAETENWVGRAERA